MAGGKTDKAKGRAKEAVGAVTDNEKLKREGRNDQREGKAKEKAERAVDKAREASRTNR